MTPTCATLFSGGELAGVGMRAAGFEHAWGIEREPAIADVARANGFAVRVGDILDSCPARFDAPDWLHASPPCPNFSVAKAGRVETPLDVALAGKVAEFITDMRPRLFTLENVYAYRNSRSFALVCRALEQGGYFYDVAHINSADYGVPQTRRRLWLRAVRGGLVPHLPPAVPWVGWYAAIEDLLGTLPESKFAPWQLARLPNNRADILIGGANRSESFLEFAKEHRKTIPGQFERAEPSPVVSATASSDMRAFIMPTVNADGTAHERYEDEPTHTIQGTAYKQMPRAFILSNSKTEFSDGQRDAAEPALAVTGQSGGRVRAFLASGGQGDYSDGTAYMTTRNEAEPAHTVTARDNQRPSRAWLVESKNSSQEYGDGLRRDDQRAPTVVTDDRPSHKPKAWLSAGRVVSMTLRALARFQSVPDSYVLPGKKSLACRVIGNGVPCLLAEVIGKGLRECL